MRPTNEFILDGRLGSAVLIMIGRKTEEKKMVFAMGLKNHLISD